jgi:predicted MFS family arabinose efflux permease
LALFVFAVITGESAGYTDHGVLSMFGAAAVAGTAFLWWQRRARHPLLELGYLRNGVFSASNIVAFAAYFATFAIFFFTALYMRVVVGMSGYRVAALFLPMMGAMILASLIAGRWTARSGARAPIVTGCVLFGVGLLLTDRYISSHPAYTPLTIALAIAGLGIGIIVVPTTFAATNAVPQARAGMASSAINTSREVGAVLGTAVLGAIVNAQLTSHLTAQLHSLGIPASFQGLVIDAVEHGGLPNSSQTSSAVAQYGKIVNEVIDAAYKAFYAGLHVSLLVSAAIVLAAAIVAAVLFRQARPADSTPPVDFPLSARPSIPPR